MASSKPEIKKPGSVGSLLAPSKFGANFGRSDSKRLFTGLKASKLTSVTQSVCGSSALSAPAQPQPNSSTETATGTVVPSKPLGEPTGHSQISSSCTPVISKVTLNTSPLDATGLENKDTAKQPKDTSSFEIKVSEISKNLNDTKKQKSSGFLFGQNCADRAANFEETTSGDEKTSGTENLESGKTSSKPSTGFTFGQNFAERASNADSDPLEKNNGKKGEKIEKESDSHSELNNSEESEKKSNKASAILDPNTSEMKPLTSPAKENSNAVSSKPQETSTALKGKTLHENAAEYFESHLAPPKRKFDEVEVITGEENEHNVLHMSCKLFLFDKSKNWLEKGRGELRLNDLSVAAANASISSSGLTDNQASRDAKRKVMSSRIVMRTIGSLRVILNTKVYHGMSVEKPNEKSVRLTGMDDVGVKVFLIVSSPKDATALHCALKSRLVELESTQEDVSKLENEENKLGQKQNDTCDLPSSDIDGASNSKKSKVDV